MVKEQIKHAIQKLNNLITIVRETKINKILAFTNNKLVHIRCILTIHNKESIQPIKSIIKIICN